MIAGDDGERAEAEPWAGFLRERPGPLPAGIAAALAGKRVLITGAGGYIGSALARTLARMPVDRLILLDHAEYGLFRLGEAMEEVGCGEATVSIVGSVCQASLLEEIFAAYRPEVVLHAAALKHVPLMETNALAAAETNALGTERVARAAARWGVTRMVLLSTDKAVAPISVMGATKRLAEMAVLARMEQGAWGPVFRAVRLPNVLGSTGSVAPVFTRQIARGGPVTVTDREATRPFLSLAAAADCLLRAAVSMEGYRLAIPVTGPARGIEELARYLMARLRPADGVAIVFRGLRAGDKLHEEFVSGGESVHAIAGEETMLAVEGALRSSPEAVEAMLREVGEAVGLRERGRLLEAIRRAVPEFGAVAGDGLGALPEEALP